MYLYELGLYVYVLVQHWYEQEMNLFAPVFQGMLVQEEFRWCKSLLFFLGHGWEKTALQRVFVCHCLTGLDSWHRQACKQAMQFLEATAFLCLHAIHKLANRLLHGRRIRPRLKKFVILLAGILVTMLSICMHWLDVWHPHICITVCSTKTCQTGLSAVQIKYILVYTSL